MIRSPFNACTQVLFVVLSISAWTQETVKLQDAQQPYPCNGTAMQMPENVHQHGQPNGGQGMDQMTGMQKANRNPFIAAITTHAISGTSAQPNSISSPMLMATR